MSISLDDSDEKRHSGIVKKIDHRAQNVANVSTELARAWQMLSGERRAFALALDTQPSPPYAEFSFVIPMTIARNAATFAVGVLMDRGDACTVAAAMFGESTDAVSGADLADACAEVCNIFADSIARHSYSAEMVHVGLPFTLNEANYAYVYSASGDGDVYQSQAEGKCLSVVVFTQSGKHL